MLPLGLLAKAIPMKGILMAGLAVGLALGGFFYGKYSQTLVQEKALRIAIQGALVGERELNNKRLVEVEKFYEEKLVNNVRTEREIIEVIKYVESDAGDTVCFDDTGVRLVNDIIKGIDLSGPAG